MKNKIIQWCERIIEWSLYVLVFGVTFSKAIAESAQTAVAASAAMEAGALGLGALVTTLATTAAVDVTGVLTASLLAALGLFIIPARRRHGKAKMMQKIAAVRSKLSQALRAQFGKEIDHSVERIKEAIVPYTRFVRAEREKIVTMQTTLQQLQDGMNQLKDNLENL